MVAAVVDRRLLLALRDALVKAASGARDTVEGQLPIHKLTLAAAKRYIPKTLAQEFDGAWRTGSFKRIDRCTRLSRTRIKAAAWPGPSAIWTTPAGRVSGTSATTPE
jgi:hypothetical protein